MRNIKWLVSAQTRTQKLWWGTHIFFHTQFIWNIIKTLTNMKNNCIFGIEANYQTVLTNFRILYISTYLYECCNYHPANTEISFSGFFSSFPLALFLSPLKVLLSPYPGPALKYFAFNKRLSFCSRCQFQSVGLQTENTQDNWFILHRDHT